MTDDVGGGGEPLLDLIVGPTRSVTLSGEEEEPVESVLVQPVAKSTILLVPLGDGADVVAAWQQEMMLCCTIL